LIAGKKEWQACPGLLAGMKKKDREGEARSKPRLAGSAAREKV
jgi:hypothetical protein